jgi:UDP-N-acetylmuramyl tripeptide synthase
MPSEKTNWFSFSLPHSRVVICANCRAAIDLKEPFLDHDPEICPGCKIECAYLDWRGRKLQIVTPNAPEVLAGTLRCLQQNFDELEYAELLTCFYEMADAVK